MLGPAAIEVEQHDLPRDSSKHVRWDGRGELTVTLRAPLRECGQRGTGAQRAVALLKDDAPLILDQLVVAEGIPVYLQVGSFSNALGVLHAALRRCIVHAAICRYLARGSRIRGVADHQVVFHADEEDGTARITLTARAPAE